MKPRAPAGSKLTRDEVLDLAARARAAGEELDLSGYDLARVDLSVREGEEVHLKDVVFGRHRGPPAADVRGTIFRQATLEHCFFADTDLTGTDLRGCTITRCDFRYATFSRTTLGDATLRLTDFYRATFGVGTVLRETRFELVSMPAAIEGAEGLAWSSFSRRKPPPLVTESEDDYREFLEWTRADRLGTYPIEGALKDRLADSARNYRNLSGFWTARGEFDDAGRAYARSRRLERQAIGPRFAGLRGWRPFEWAWLWLADLLCGFGENLALVVPWIVAVALIPGFLYGIFGGVHGAHDLGDKLLFSASQLTASTPDRLKAANSLVEWIRVLQTLAGVALLGLFGFVLGNKIRNS